jgi:hypothetical protein
MPEVNQGLTSEMEQTIDQFMEENKELMDKLAVLEEQEKTLNSQPAVDPSTPEEVLDTRSPEEIEKELLAKAEEDARLAAENRPPEETAAIMFHMFYPQFKNLLIGLSNKELKRLIKALIGRGHQSEPDVPSFNDEKTGAAFKMGTELLAAKFMMIQKLELDAFEKAQSEREARELAASAQIVDERVENSNKEGNVNE